LKIAMYNLTTTARYGGVETFVWAVSRQLAERGEEVHIIGGKGNIHQNIPGVKIFQFPFLPRKRVPNLGTRFRKLVERWSFGLFSLGTMLREDYDIFHVHKPFDLPLGAAVRALKGSKLVLGSHGTDFFWGDRLFARRADALVSCSDFNGKEIERRYGRRPAVIFNGVDPEVFRPLPPDGEIQKQLGLPPGQNHTIIYAGRLIGWKGIGELLRAVAILKDTFSLRLIIVGAGETRSSWQNLSYQLGIGEKATFTGFIPNRELPRYYSLADVAVFPSLADETFGISICEAMACKVPVVSTRVGGIPEVVEDGVTGLLVPPRKPQELAEKIAVLLRDEPLRKNTGEKARQRVLDKFTWSKVTGRLLDVYGEMMGRPRPSGN
jgi:D-inositol-3-phosphate glycosyltransferase